MFKSTSSYSSNRTDRRESRSQVCVRSHMLEMIFPLTRRSRPPQHSWKGWSIPLTLAFSIALCVIIRIAASLTAYTFINKKETSLVPILSTSFWSVKSCPISGQRKNFSPLKDLPSCSRSFEITHFMTYYNFKLSFYLYTYFKCVTVV